MRFQIIFGIMTVFILEIDAKNLRCIEIFNGMSGAKICDSTKNGCIILSVNGTIEASCIKAKDSKNETTFVSAANYGGYSHQAVGCTKEFCNNENNNDLLAAEIIKEIVNNAAVKLAGSNSPKPKEMMNNELLWLEEIMENATAKLPNRRELSGESAEYFNYLYAHEKQVKKEAMQAQMAAHLGKPKKKNLFERLYEGGKELYEGGKDLVEGFKEVANKVDEYVNPKENENNAAEKPAPGIKPNQKNLTCYNNNGASENCTGLCQIKRRIVNGNTQIERGCTIAGRKGFQNYGATLPAGLYGVRYAYVESNGVKEIIVSGYCSRDNCNKESEELDNILKEIIEQVDTAIEDSVFELENTASDVLALLSAHLLIIVILHTLV